MRKIWSPALALFAAALTAFSFSSTARADDKADYTGTWKWSATMRNNTVNFSLKLKQDGDKVTGTISGQGAQDTEIKDGKVADGELSFKVVRSRNGTDITTTYTGKLEGDSIKGKAETTGGATTRPARDWTATRAKEGEGDKKEGGDAAK